MDMERVKRHARDTFEWAKNQVPETGREGTALGRLQAMASICEGAAGIAAELRAALEELLDAAPAFRVKKIGADGSEARKQQDAHIAAEDRARAAIAKAKGG
jgi:hypothetical protein